MHIESVGVANYKSFFERQTLHFESGFNLLIGTNNAGKTTVLDVLDMDFSLNEPHRSERTIPRFGGQPVELSEFEVTLATRVGELRALAGSTQLYLPIASFDDIFNGRNSLETVRTFVERDEPLQLISKFGHGMETVNIVGNDLIRGLATRQNGGALQAALVQFSPNQPQPQVQFSNFGGAHQIVGNYAQLFKGRIYRFSAQRRPGAQCGAQTTMVLDREATALPYCINHLQTNDAHGHRQLCSWVSRVFPSVKWVQAPPIGTNFELRCLPHLPEVRRDDLSIPLSRMGAGIGNVIAMFYVVLTSRDPQVIAIDEPNAFLHPRALRELLAILESEGKQHQFILTAHSADVLTAVSTRSISLLDFDGVATTVQQVGQKDLHTLRGGLAELGIRMTDLHAKDRVFWVEGQTEELVMPELLRWACPEVASGTSVLRVERTGTFSKKGVEPAELVQIYERLSSSSALVPPMICILLDGEIRSKKSRDAIEESSQGKLRFLDRRMLENYLLHPGAVTSVLSELGLTSSIETVGDCLSQAIGSTEVSEIDGAKVLNTLFSKLSDAQYEFRKTRDVQTLIAWIIENDPDYLEPLRVCLRKSFGI
jgi:energy-coupling factor transporter ATP-binding protein EcfA2